MEPEFTIIEALMLRMHEKDQQSILSGELADVVNVLFKQRGESLTISPESVGRKLSNLELHTEVLGSAGKGLKFTNDVRARVHALAREYRIPTLQMVKGCPQCDAFFPGAGEVGDEA